MTNTYMVGNCPGPRCIKLFARVFYGKNQETPAKKNVSIAICIEICQSFFYGKKSLAKSFMQRFNFGPGGELFPDTYESIAKNINALLQSLHFKNIMKFISATFLYITTKMAIHRKTQI